MRRVSFVLLFICGALSLAAWSSNPIPKGSKLYVRFSWFISSATAHLGDTVDGELTRDIPISKEINIPAGSHVNGRVSRVQGASPDGSIPGMIAVTLESIDTPDVRYVFATRDLEKRGRPISGKDSNNTTRKREAANSISDTISGISSPKPSNVPGQDEGIHVSVERQAVEATIAASIEYKFVTIADAKELSKKRN